MVDGYAVRSCDSASGTRTYTIVEEVFAGQVPINSVEEGQTTSIMTGAPMPQGADAVVMHEKTMPAESQQRIRIPGPVQPHQNVMGKGEEMKQGEMVLHEGTVLHPQVFGLLATLGKSTFRVYRQPVVAVLSTGDEVIEPGEPLGPGQIRNSNGPMLMAQVMRAQGTPRYLGIAKDQPDSLRPFLLNGLTSDVLIVTGGVSAGKADLLPEMLTELGVEPIFHKVSLKPGKPIFFGVKGQTLVFGLPGNPVSGHIGFELFVRPALRKMMGRAEPVLPQTVPCRLATDFHHKSDRQTFYPTKLQRTNSILEADPVAWRGSGDLRSICAAGSFAVLPPGEHFYPAGSMIEVMVDDD